MANPFMEKDQQPDEKSLQQAFQSAYPFYQELMELAKPFQKDWHFYKPSGWVLKVYDSKKVLFYVIPDEHAYTVRFTLREKERDLLLENPAVAFAHAQIASAKEYFEGFLVQTSIEDEVSASRCKTFIAEVIKLRRPSK